MKCFVVLCSYKYKKCIDYEPLKIFVGKDASKTYLNASKYMLEQSNQNSNIGNLYKIIKTEVDID